MAFSKVAYVLVSIGGLLACSGMAHPAAAASAFAQQPAPSQAAANRLVGAITSIDGKTLTIKPDTGAPTTVVLSDTARILRTAPGAKTLAGASPIAVSDLAVGDRVLIAIHPAADGSAPTATTVVAMKQADIAQQQQAEQADWQRRGAGGLVKSIDLASGTITVAAGAKVWIIHATPKTIVRRYDPESIKFADAKPSTLDKIRPGDQLRARGEHSADGNEIAAEEIVTGSFRNIAGTVVSTDPAADTVTVTDLATKKPVVIHISADSQLHKLPAMMAQALAARFKSGGAGANPAPPPAATPSEGGSGSRPGGQRGGDVSQFLQRTPVLQLSELHQGDAVMIVATQGTPDAATAVTLLAGVEPILTASPAASQNMFSASWNLGGSGAEGEGTQ
jgi:hypothetical protein